MKMSRDRVLVLVLLPALVVVGALALRGRPPGEAAIAASPPPVTPPRPLTLAPAAQARNPVKIAPAELAKLGGDIQVVGTVAFHEDHFAVVGPLVPGRISKVTAGVGDKVKRGQVIAEIESSEVGQARADYLSAKARSGAAEANLIARVNPVRVLDLRVIAPHARPLPGVMEVAVAQIPKRIALLH